MTGDDLILYKFLMLYSIQSSAQPFVKTGTACHLAETQAHLIVTQHAIVN